MTSDNADKRPLKILFLDDEKNRHDRTAWWFDPKDEVTHVWSAAEAIGLYYMHQMSLNPEDHFDLVSLDHDLGDYKWDGRDVVKAILVLHTQIPNLPKPEFGFAIHSWNLPMADIMWYRLKDAGFEVSKDPFHPNNGFDIPGMPDNE